tara:strand:- start:371 stop:568 length:198 start_codon:yes stop_codon:yes gene_type:complete
MFEPAVFGTEEKVDVAFIRRALALATSQGVGKVDSRAVTSTSSPLSALWLEKTEKNAVKSTDQIL